jgi:uncharacterized protein YjbI with pentapeptide repeats
MVTSRVGDESAEAGRYVPVACVLQALDFIHAAFHFAELRDWDCASLSFAQASFSNTLLAKAMFKGCDFSNTLFDQSVLVDCVIENSLFHSALLLGVTFKRCVLLDVDFSRAMFRGCCFEDCRINGCTFSDGLVWDNELDIEWAELRVRNVFVR